LQHASHWDLGFVQDAGHRKQYKTMVDRILSALDFMRVCGVGGDSAPALRTVDFYVSHEGLQLGYEEALTRPVPVPSTSLHGIPKIPSGMIAANSSSSYPPSKISTAPAAGATGKKESDISATSDPATPVHPPAAAAVVAAASSSKEDEAAKETAATTTPATTSEASTDTTTKRARSYSTLYENPTRPSRYYNLGTHFLWIGDRTRQLDHGHVEYCRGITNPVGIKVSQ
jgi:Class-II DAHP synthetase family